MRLLALDIATQTGWAAGDTSRPGRCKHGVYRNPDAGASVGRFLNTFAFWLAQKIVDVEPVEILFEAPILTETTSLIMARKLYGLAGICEMVALNNGLDEDHCHEIESSKWRSGFLGQYMPQRPRGRKPRPGEMRDLYKEAAIKVATLSGYTPICDDDAEAIGIWTYGQSVRTLGARIRKGDLL